MLINPMWFYLGDIFDSLKFLGKTGSLISLLVVVILKIIEHDIKKSQTKEIKTSFIMMIIFIVIFVLSPSKKATTEMIIASQITEENAEAAKEVVDYVIEKINDMKGE